MEYKIYRLIDPITNLPFYIGQTSKELEERLEGHKNQNKHHNSNLGKRFRTFIKKGVLNNLIIELVEISTEEQIDMRELEVIDNYRKMGFKLCNSIILHPNSGKKTVTDDVRKKHSESAKITNKGRKYNENTIKKMSNSAKKRIEKYGHFDFTTISKELRKQASDKTKKKVSKYDLFGNLLNIYSSLTEAALQNNLDISQISACCKGKVKMVHNFIFKFYDYKLTQEDLNLGKIWVNLINLETEEELEFKSIREASKFLGINRGKIQYAIKTGKFLFKTKGKSFKIVVKMAKNTIK